MNKPKKILKLFETKNVCKKVYFATKAAADYHIKKKSGEGGSRPAHSYLCFKCNCWHITSWTELDINAFIDQFNSEVDEVNKYMESCFNSDIQLMIDMGNELVDLRNKNKKLELEVYNLKHQKK